MKETFNFTDFKNVENIPGIYLITNLINGKHYVGQSISLRDRLALHYHNSLRNNESKFKYLIYRAINKYGVENFSITILESSKEFDKPKLDELEKYYIKEYESFGPKGYNMTCGGDGGVLGYHHTEEMKKHLSLKTKEKFISDHQDKSTWVKAKNLDTGEIFEAMSMIELSFMIDVHQESVSKCIKGEYKTCGNTFVCARYNDEFPEHIERNSGQYTSKFTLEEYKAFLDEHPNYTQNQLSEELHICKKTINNYNNLLKQQGLYNLKTNKINHYEIINIETNEILNMSLEECCDYFGIKESSFRKQSKRKGIYKKKYKINIIYK